MSYNPNIPNPPDFLALSQKQILANFQTINKAFVQDHVALGLSNQGMHNSLTLRPQSIDPTTGANQCAIYNKLVSGTPQLFFRSNVGHSPIQWSNSNLSTLDTGSVKGSQSSFLAGPFTIYMGFVLNSPNNNIITLTPSSTLIYVGLSTSLNSPRIPTTVNVAIPVNIAANQFTIRYVTALTIPPTIYYMAIGK